MINEIISECDNVFISSNKLNRKRNTAKVIISNIQ